MQNFLADTLSSSLNVLGVFFAFSILIFVHEFGHYLAALYVGVRVEKFMIGFDVWGLGFKKNIRGTEYGVGILPLGGYVKIAGQSDLPGEDESTGASDELINKGVGARCLVFIAGVVMNFILGFCLLVVAQLYGVPRVPAVLGYIHENGPADRAGLRAGDRVVAINGKQIKWFEEILQKVALSGGKALDFTVKREIAGKASSKVIRIIAEEGQGRGNLFTISAEIPYSREIMNVNAKEKFTYSNGSPAQLKPGDRILKIDGKEISDDFSGGQIYSLVEPRAGQIITLTVASGTAGNIQEKQIQTRVYPTANSVYDFGLRYMRQIKEIPDSKSPAAISGLLPGDWIGAVNGESFAQPQALISKIMASSLCEITIKIRRKGKEQDILIKPASMTGDPRITAGKDNFLGILATTSVDNKFIKIEKVLTGGPSQDKLLPGDELLSIGDEKCTDAKKLHLLVEKHSTKNIELSIVRQNKELKIKLRAKIDPKIGIPRIGIIFEGLGIFKVISNSLAEKLGISRGDYGLAIKYADDLKKTYVSWKRSGTKGKITEFKDKSFATPEFVLKNPNAAGIKGKLSLAVRPNIFMDKTQGVFLACKQALPKLLTKTLFIYQTIKKLVLGEIRITATGGPLIIIKTMYLSASVGWGKLLDISALISINLAVLNLLPIPVLDGGHILFLLIEWIKGSKPSVKIREYAQYAGFICLIGLMLLVTFFDVYYSWFKD